MKERNIKPKTAQDAPQRPPISRHALILARDDNALAAHQTDGNEQKTGLFREYQQGVMAI